MLTDAEEVEGALVDWINTCFPDADVEEFDDLADGAILADTLQLFAPEVDPSNTAAGSAKLLHGCLSSYFGQRISLPRLAGNMHNGAFCKPLLLRALTEAVLLAAVEGPRKEEAIQAIMNLDEPKQMALGSALQRIMAESATGDPGSSQQNAEHPESGPPTPRAETEYKTEADFLHDEIQDLQERCNAEMRAIDGLENSEQALQAQLRAVMVDFIAEEEQAAEADAMLQKWQRAYGDDLRHFKAECNALRQDLHKETENAKDAPQRDKKLRSQLDHELHACRELQDNTDKLEVELRQAAQANENDDLSTVKAEMMTSQMQQNVVDRLLRRAEGEEKEQMRIAKNLWETLHATEVTAQSREDTHRHLRRVAEKEEESEADVVGLLEFRESEMRQLHGAMEEDTASTRGDMGKRSSMRGSISGPPGGVDLLRLMPDLAERRVLVKDLSRTSRSLSTWQTELSQQQQRSRELEHRLQQLEDEANQLHNSEAKALTEYGLRKEEEQKLAAECREREYVVQAEVRRANLEKNQMQGTRHKERAELQAQLAQLRAELSEKRREEEASKAKLAETQKAIAASEAAERVASQSAAARIAAARAQQEDVEAHQELTRLQSSLADLSHQQPELRSEEEVQRQTLHEMKQQESTQQKLLEERQKELMRSEQQQRVELQKQKQQQEQRQQQKQKQMQASEPEAKEPPPALPVQAGQAMTPEQAGSAAAASARSAGKSPQESRSTPPQQQPPRPPPRRRPVEPQAMAAAEAASAAMAAFGAEDFAQRSAAADAAGAAALVAAKVAGKSKKEQIRISASCALMAATAAGATPLAMQEAAELAAVKAAKGTGLEAEAKPIAEQCLMQLHQGDAPEPPPVIAKSNKAALKRLRQQLAEQERKMRYMESAQGERSQAMRNESQLLADSLREVGLRCQMLVGKHRMLLDDRKRLESEA
ncbi:unnamed protein product [Effrenium voratum]|nr:unnamed protein product [Effrenium voratum]